jgi:CMP-N-acetylneuraminic acid synthetase
VTPLCVIPARRGSKRLPEKNVADLRGRPMLAYTVEAALDSGLFDRVLVSTEDEGIAALAAALGATPHARPPELAGDLVSSTDVCLEALSSEPRGDEDAVVCLQPSSPLRTSGDIRGAWDTFLGADADFLVSVTPIDPHYFHWALEPDGEWHHMVFGDRYLVERPLLPTRYRPNGAIKIGRAGPLRERRDFFGPRLAVYEMPEERSVHVATAFDLQLAEQLR